MGKKRIKTRTRLSLQGITLCISTALVLILLGMVVFSVLTARNFSSYVKENLVVTMMFEQDMTQPESRQLCSKLMARPYIKSLKYISKEDALREQRDAMGFDPTEFIDGDNPFLPSLELIMHAEYANSDSLEWVCSELGKYPNVGDVTYQKDLVDDVNNTLAKINIILLVLALLLTFISFTLINSSVRLSIYARRFRIHTMKLVGAPWSFIRRPFLFDALLIGMVAAIIACVVLACGVYAYYKCNPAILDVATCPVIFITVLTVFFSGVTITVICSAISVNKFLRMTAGELYKI